MSKDSSAPKPSKKDATEDVKREYFVPAYGVTVEATDAADAVEQAEKLKKQREDGDG